MVSFETPRTGHNSAQCRSEGIQIIYLTFAEKENDVIYFPPNFPSRLGLFLSCLVHQSTTYDMADNQFNAKPVVKQRHPGDEFPVSQRGSTKGK